MRTTPEKQASNSPNVLHKVLFSVVATPIGNLEDITLRAIRTLKDADLVLCEDTRVTKNLFKKYDITAPTMSYHARSGDAKVETILDMLAGGGGESARKFALVSDAGTPGISDPGAYLVAMIRERFAAEIASGEFKIEAIPGASAFVAALSVAGVPCADFTFLGFLPHKKGRETLFEEIAASDRTMIFYESPHRILKSLDSLGAHFGEEGNGRSVVIGRELTKIFEEIVRGTPSELISFFEKNPDKVRGEFVVIVPPAK